MLIPKGPQQAPDAAAAPRPQGVAAAGEEEPRPRLLLRPLRRHLDHPWHRHLRRPPRGRPQVHRVLG